jgi:hypothetical protein
MRGPGLLSEQVTNTTGAWPFRVPAAERYPVPTMSEDDAVAAIAPTIQRANGPPRPGRARTPAPDPWRSCRSILQPLCPPANLHD